VVLVGFSGNLVDDLKIPSEVLLGFFELVWREGWVEVGEGYDR
jgi:hypothetical protein